MTILKRKYFLFLAVLFLILISSCANQLPPSGGDDDKTPPKIISIYPKPDKVNFKDNVIRLKFDEYVDRRSFEESFFISPKPKGNIEFSWSGKEVEVEFSNAFDKNRTYVVIIGKDLRDVRGANKISSPVTFAFSTGSSIDKGSLSGNVFSDNYDRVKIMAYLKTGKPADSLNPERTIPDYIIQVSEDGTFQFTNLPDGEYRLFAITDEDRNNLFDMDVDKIAMLTEDHILSGDSNKAAGLNFLLKDFDINRYGKEFTGMLTSDSANFIYSNIANGEKNIIPDYRFYFYFRNTSLAKSDIVGNFSVTDSANGKSYKLVFNWLTDSLLEVFSTEKFSLSSALKLSIDLSRTGKKYIYERRFTVASKSNFGKVSGKIISDERSIQSAYIKLYNKNNKFVTYSTLLAGTPEFSFGEVLEGNYILMSFIDENGNGKPDEGNYFPFSPSEKFFIYDKELKVKGGWNVENVFIKF